MERLNGSTESYISQYLHNKAGRMKLPVSATFELTSRCNFNCKMCYVHDADCSRDKPLELTAAQWIDIAEQAEKAGTLFLLLTGGEPLLREDFNEIYAAIAKMGFVISVNTNLSLLTEETVSRNWNSLQALMKMLLATSLRLMPSTNLPMLFSRPTSGV